jgi:alanine dehydrogenase
MTALLVDRATIASLMTVGDYFDAVEGAFAAAAEGRATSPPPLHIAAEGGGFHAKGAILDGEPPLVALKLNANFPANPGLRGLPTIQGVILLCDARDGRLLAVLDSAEITLRRTAAASAVAASRLARPNSSVLAVCGCGAQAPAQIEAIAAMLPIRRVLVFDADPAKSRAFAAAHEIAGQEVEAVADLAAATLSADVIVTCTTACAAFLTPDLVGDGAFVAAVGADSPDKHEIAPALLARSRVAVDSLEQCLAMGDLRHAVAAGAMGADDVAATLASLASGAHLGRANERETWVFDSTGTAIQDVASAFAVFRRAEAASAGTPFAFA